MYCMKYILNKLDLYRKNSATFKTQFPSDSESYSLSHFTGLSFPEINKITDNVLTWGERNFLYQQAQNALKENRMEDIRILSRANPQLANAVRLGICQSANRRSYDDLFGNRAGKFVKPGSVASMFSPAGYLTELYLEARKLHEPGSEHHLDIRRPDLASLSLSQQNMEDELSTLSLSNELLMEGIQVKEGKNYDKVMEMLSAYRFTSDTPFHLSYETIRQSIFLRDETFSAFRRNPDVTARVDSVSLLAMKAHISPELLKILTENITDANADTLIKENFGDTNIRSLQSLSALARHYGLTYEELSPLLNILIHNDARPDVQHYRNDRLVTLLNDGETLESVLITRTAGHNAYQFGYTELIPVGGNNYVFNFTIVDNPGKGSLSIGTDGKWSSDIFQSDNYDIRKNNPESFPLTLSEEQIKKDVIIAVTRKNGGYYANVNFNITRYSFSIFLLKLNKLIRLWKATGISPVDILSVIESESTDNDLTINIHVLNKLFRIHDYMQYYHLDASASLVLAGAAISQVSHGGERSVFTRLFNSPPLNGQEFYADDTITINLNPAENTNTFHTGVLKRAFQVNDAELYTLWSLINRNTPLPSFTCTIDNLSLMYRVKLLAEVHGLTVTELALLLSVTPYAKKSFLKMNAPDLIALTSYLDQCTRWIKAQGWTVDDLWLMLTEHYSTDSTPEIKTLQTTLRDGLTGQIITPENQYTLAAPFIAAATGLDSTEIAADILRWLEQLKPEELSVYKFLSLMVKDSLTAEENKQIIAFCQVLGQLVLVVRSLKLTSAELSLAVTMPGCIQFKSESLPHSLATVRWLAYLHRWLLGCETSATEVLDALKNKELTPVKFARAMKLDEQMVTQGMKQHNDALTFIQTVEDVDIVMQWVDMATTLGITPDGVASLVALKFSEPDTLPDWKQWGNISHSLQAGLDRQQTECLQAVLDEALSAALSAYAIKKTTPAWVTDRKTLYGYLLLDNQVSAQVKTTRLAEAIASVQLYVNRSLNGQEGEEVNNIIKTRQFFIDWDRYNKRYSTWSAVSQLVYYPENYIDPAVRVGQTGMMNEMLQSLSQSELTRDSVEEAFKTYMTRFEEIANLEVISGYHDGISDQSGTTYIVGRSDIGDYYWRSADIGKLSSGKLPANAWTEWKKITVAVTPVNNLLRPVIFQSRLYLVWGERRETGKASGGTTEKTVEYLLKYAHILHDGNWSAPQSIITQPGILPLSEVSIDDTGLYCARDVEQEKLYICSYQKGEDYSNGHRPLISGLQVYADGKAEKISDTDATLIATYIHSQLDTSAETRLNTPYVGGETFIRVSGPERTGYEWGDGAYTVLWNSKLSGVTAKLTEDKNNVDITLNAAARVVHNGYAGSRSRTQVNMMKDTGRIGDVFYLPKMVQRSDAAHRSGRDFECVFRKNGDGYDTSVLVTDDLPHGDFDVMVCFNSPSDDQLNGSLSAYHNTRWLSQSAGNWKLWYEEHANSDDLKPENYLYALITPQAVGQPIELMFGDFVKTDTQITTEKVKLFIPEAQQTFTSDKCSKYTFDESLFDFIQKKIALPLNAFIDNTAQVSFIFSASAPTGDGRSLGSETLTLTLTRVDKSNMPVISLNKTAANAQYLQYGIYCVRVNTLFAKQLTAYANTGLNRILSMETQQLEEPKLGEGAYITMTLAAYDKSIHGTSREFSVWLYNVFEKGDKFILASGMLSDRQTTIRFFIPYVDRSDHKNLLELFAKYHSGETSNCIHIKKGDSDDWVLDETYYGGTFKGLVSVSGLHEKSEPMDFSGANALYFWEMFYYVPMMVFQRLKQEGQFTEAAQWLKYVWSPEGYLEHGQPATYQWNVRPLEEDTSWNASPLDSVDPDAVAQADPMHYKVATFMGMLDLLIARGDAAYRMLERDMLNEAKMWYTQALNILGDEPWLTLDEGWAAPRLDVAADQTTHRQAQQAMLAIRQQAETDDLRSANSLTSLFLPQQNEKLHGYWQTLAQRLYNLRHNLSIDGMPLSLSVYATPVDPAALHSAALMSALGGADLPQAVMPLHRFPVILDNAKGMVSQLSQFGSTLLSLSERQDAEALSEMLQTQGAELALQNIAMQESTIASFDADRAALEETRRGAQKRLESYTALYEENVSSEEKNSTNLLISAATFTYTSTASHAIGAALNLAPNVFGLATGGSQWGGMAYAVGLSQQTVANGLSLTSQAISQSEMYRRRRQEWGILRDNAESEVKQVDAQLRALAVRREAAVMQKNYLETQQAQTRAQLAFLQNKFSNRALYNWLRGKLSAIYYQFYDLTVSRCLMAQEAYKWALGENSAHFIRPGAWQGTGDGLMAGETLMLNLAQMEQSYLQKDTREKEVMRTVCLSEFYNGLGDDGFVLTDKITELLIGSSDSAGSGDNVLEVKDNQLLSTLKLSDLAIGRDYPDTTGKLRRIKQISVTLPALTGPYQDVRAVLSYGGSVILPRGCQALAISHGMNDNGQFQLDFSDSRWLPFEGIPVDDTGTLTLTFPDARNGQKALLLSLSDIILHIRYTIR